MKRFFQSFLGALAAIWVSLAIMGILAVVFIVAIAVSELKQQPVKVNHGSALVLTLEGELTEREQSLPLLEQIYTSETTNRMALNQLIASLRHAKNDGSISGLIIDCRGLSAGAAQIDELRRAILDFGNNNKWIYAYGDNITQSDYIIASAADEIILNPVGTVDIHGLSSTTLYFKDLLSKIGVEVQVVKVGSFKSAVEPFVRSDMSEANRLQQEAFLSSMWSYVSSEIATHRMTGQDTVNAWADEFTFALSPESYVAQGLVTRLLYRHEFDQEMASLTGSDDSTPKTIDIEDYYAARNLDTSPASSHKDHIAVVYAVGDITESGEGGISSDVYVPLILKLAEDKHVRGLILRVNSGGGSAFASEQIWEALEQYKTLSGNPFYVSMGDYAASGGYYISCGADRIYADPLTLTGSIGIFGMIPNAESLMSDKLGITTSTVSTNKGNFPTLFKPMTEQQRAGMQGYVERGYKLFTSRVAEGRELPIDSVLMIAEGRVWDAQQALKIGLVDKLGTLDNAIYDMNLAIGEGDNDLEGANLKVREYPAVSRNWYDELISSARNVHTAASLKALGEMGYMIEVASQLHDIDPLQARMDYVTIR